MHHWSYVAVWASPQFLASKTMNATVAYCVSTHPYESCLQVQASLYACAGTKTET